MPEPGSLIGREQELTDIRAHRAATRLITLVGPGGVGKTTLASAAVAGEAGVLFARLASLPPVDLNDSLAGNLGFRSFAAFSSALEGRPATMILDNCEHVIGPVADIAEDLLESHPQLTIIATSREPLHLAGEQVVTVAPLSTVGDPSPAAQLFVRRMENRGLPVPPDLTDVEALCRRLDGLPLALELAASRAASMTPSEIESHLSSRLDLLSRSTERGHERHQSITAAVGWSHQLLDDDLQQLFELLSVFSGTFTPRMASSLADIDDLGRVAQMLGALVDRSLLVHEPDAGSSWFRMLSTIRAYGVTRLQRSGRWDALNERLVDQAVGASQRIRAAAMTQDAPETGPEAAQLFRVMRAAVDWCVANDETASRAQRIAAAFAAIEDSGFQAEAADVADLVISHWGVEDAEVFGVLAMMARASGQVDRGHAAARRSVDTGGVGEEFGYRVLGLIARADADFDASAGHFQMGARAARRHGHEGYALELENHAALAVARSGGIEEAVAEFDRIAALADSFSMVRTMSLLMAGITLIGTDLVRSIEYSTRCLAEAEAVDYAWAANHARQQLALVRYLNGETEIGTIEMADSIAFAATRGSRSETWLGLRFAARMFAAHGKDGEASASIGAARRVFGDPAIGPSEQAALDAIHPTDPQSDTDTSRIPELVSALKNLAVGKPDVGADTTEPRRFERNGDVWEIEYRGRRGLLAPSKGLADLAMLLSQPRTDLAALDLADAVVVAGDSGPISDAAARRSYQDRIRDLSADVEDADAAGDTVRSERARQELDALVAHLSAAYGLAGTERTTGSVAEKARGAVTWRIRSAIKKIAESNPELATHLDLTVRTGRFCRYDADPDPPWSIHM